MAEFLSHPLPAVVLMLGLLVFVHEFGHFIVGRWAGIAVEIFSIGFGPKIFGWRRAGTEYRLSWLPLGGFVKFAGAHPSEDVPLGLAGIPFREAPLYKRALTIFAGPFANLLLAMVVYTILAKAGIPHPPAIIGEVLENSAAAAAGVQAGDRVLAINGQDIKTWRDLEKTISGSPGKELSLLVERSVGEQVIIPLTPAAVSAEDLFGKKITIGRAGIALGRLPPIVAVTDATSAAARAGLKTGDRVLAIMNEGQTWETPGASELMQAIEAAVAAGGASTVRLRVTTEAQASSGNNSVLFLDLAPARDRPNLPKGREAMHILGIDDGQLAIAEGSETLAGVLQHGDVLTAWEGKPLADIFALRELLLANQSPRVRVTINRNFRPLEIDLQLKPIEVQKPEGVATMYMLPAIFLAQPEEPEPVFEKYDSFIAAGMYGLRETGSQTVGLIDNVVSLLTGQIPLKVLGGPMLIAKVAGDSARRGWQTFLSSMALISINLAVLNLLPIPVLDGGQLVLMAGEAILRRPLREVAVENFQKVGFAMVLALVVLATYNDLSRFWKSMVASVVGSMP